MTHRYFIVDVFTERVMAGNQLAVVLDAGDLDADTMQSVAREFNFSETTFVSRSHVPECEWRVRIFTPSIELPMAGHPTVGTALLLHREGLVGAETVFELKVGPTPVSIDGGRAVMRQRPPDFGEEIRDRAAIAAALSIEEADLALGWPVQGVSCGVEHGLVPLRSVEVLGRLRMRPELWPLPLSAFCFAVEDGGTAARARMFWPAGGIVEDPATGSAGGPLASYLRLHLPGFAGSVRILQGVEMGRPSEIEASVAGDEVRVGGSAAVFASGEFGHH